MKIRTWNVTPIVLALVILIVTACVPQKPTALTESLPQGMTEQLSEAFSTVLPTEKSVPTSGPLNYDPEIYSDLENLDPGGQLVTFWFQYSGAHEELMLSLIDEFNRTNEWAITVQGESQDSLEKLSQKIIAGIPASQLPSMAMAYQDQAATYAAQGALVALGPYAESKTWGYTEEELNDFYPVALTADHLPQFDARYGWPHYKSMEVMYYNEDWLTELGYTAPPETWEEFGEMACAAASQPFSGATGEGDSYRYVYSITSSQFATFVFSRGANLINRRGTGYVFNEPASLDALTFLKDLADRGCAAEEKERYGDQSDFGSGQSLFAINSISQLPHYQRAVDEGAGFKWSVSPPPHTTAAPRMNLNGPSQSVFVSTPREQLAAWLFIKWMSQPEQQATWMAGSGYFTTRQATADLLTDYFTENPIYEKALRFMSYDYGIEPPVTGYDRCQTTIEDALVAVLDGEGAQARLDAAKVQCDEYLNQSAP